MMTIFIIILIVMLVVFGAVGYFAFKKIKETDPNSADNSVKRNIATAQQFLPFEDIKDNMMDLGQHQYRAIIKCESLNYSLKSDKEQNVIELAYQSFLNSLTHPIQMFIVTKTMDNTNMLKILKTDITEAIKDFPILEEYGEVFYEDMGNIYSEIGNNKEKNKYIIVPYNDSVTLTNSNDDEKYEYSYKELQNRCQILMEGLQSVGVKCSLLDTKGIIELLYTTYHKDNVSQAENIINGEFLKMSVKGKDKLAEIKHEDILDWILYEAQLRLETEICNDKTSNSDVKERASVAINDISSLRDNIAGKYKTDFNINDKIDFYE